MIAAILVSLVFLRCVDAIWRLVELDDCWRANDEAIAALRRMQRSAWQARKSVAEARRT